MFGTVLAIVMISGSTGVPLIPQSGHVASALPQCRISERPRSAA
jgi:hypothetical protein